ncbi:MAG: NAD(P)H-hydrate dehydratase [Butyrivibrio sp.]|nr:NAD(P)H-hydrate dehydratase [Butyrivibrio sp.]
MKYAVTSSEMKIYDRNTSEYFGVPSQVLMERASLKTTEHILKWIKTRNCDRKYKALVVCGVGNNGGDGACIARLLKLQGILVNICIVGDYTRCSDLLLKQLDILGKYGTKTDTFSNIRDNKSSFEWDIIVDAMFGIGLSRPVTGDYADAVDYINSCKKDKGGDVLVVSVDIPSGINADNGLVCQKAVNADVTVTFNHAKIGQLLYPGYEYTGKLIIEDAGITNESFLDKEPRAFYYDEDIRSLLPLRKADANKGTYGKVLLMAGSENISGACILAAKALFKAGAGMVRIFTAAENAEVIKETLPEAMLETYSSKSDIENKLDMLFDWSSAAVLGPGIGMSETAKYLVKKTISGYSKDLVLDADAINLVADSDELKGLLSNFARSGKRLILTPHLGEFSRLFGKSISECKLGILSFPKELAETLHCTVVCKDARTIVADSNEKKIYINMSGNDGMATAGSGDVLSGVMGALLSYKLSSFMTATLGVYLHGLAGDEAAYNLGKSAMTASDIADYVGNLLK